MARIERSIEIKASVDKVFIFAADWQNKFKLKWWPGIIDWKPTTEKTRGDGARFVFQKFGFSPAAGRGMGLLLYISPECCPLRVPHQ